MLRLTGLVTALEQWVLDATAAQMAQWRATLHGGRDAVAVHVNVSPIALRAPGFADEVLACLARHGVPPGDVTVEVTEHPLLEEDVATMQTMQTLRGVGVRVAIDDFGTGCSSLSHVRRSFVDTIKIDPSRMGGLDVGVRQRQVTAALLALVDRTSRSSI